MKKQRKSSFRGRVAHDSERQVKEASAFGYLNLPKDVSVLSFEKKARVVYLDFLPYEVTDQKHPDRNEETGAAMDGELWYKRPFKIHRSVGSNKETIVCPTSIGKPCPICEYFRKQINEKAEWDDIKHLKPSQRNLYVVVPVDDKKNDAVPHILDISQFCMQDTINEELLINPENEVFPDLEEGKTAEIKLSWTSIGDNDPFPKARAIKFEDRDAYVESILEVVPNLDELLDVLSYKQIEAKFFDMEDETTNEEIEEVTEDENMNPSDEIQFTRKRKLPYQKTKESESKPDASERRTRTRTREPQKQTEDECPHGHKFAHDYNKYKECDECDKWEDCDEANEKLNE